jgi:hypothetical protein
VTFTAVYLRYVVRYDGPFGVRYLQQVHVVNAGRDFGAYTKPNDASKFRDREAAESYAILIAARNPSMIGKVSVRAWDGRKRYP